MLLDGFDVVLAGALLDVMPEIGPTLDRLLAADARWVILHRQRIDARRSGVRLYVGIEVSTRIGRLSLARFSSLGLPGTRGRLSLRLRSHGTSGRSFLSEHEGSRFKTVLTTVWLVPTEMLPIIRGLPRATCVTVRRLCLLLADPK